MECEALLWIWNMFSEKPPPSSLKGNHFLDTYDDDDDERIIFFPPSHAEGGSWLGTYR